MYFICVTRSAKNTLIEKNIGECLSCGSNVNLVDQQLQWKLWGFIPTPSHRENIAKCDSCGREIREVYFPRKKKMEVLHEKEEEQ